MIIIPYITVSYWQILKKVLKLLVSPYITINHSFRFSAIPIPHLCLHYLLGADTEDHYYIQMYDKGVLYLSAENGIPLLLFCLKYI